LIAVVPLVRLTGVPGAGKSSVIDCLRRRGFPARDADDGELRAGGIEPRVSSWRLKNYGPPRSGRRDRYSLDLIPDRVRQLRDALADDVGILGGYVPNEPECLGLFDAVIALALDDSTMISRLDDRPGRTFGKTREARQVILRWNA
jgi:broad-specificity NMP kinase